MSMSDDDRLAEIRARVAAIRGHGFAVTSIHEVALYQLGAVDVTWLLDRVDRLTADLEATCEELGHLRQHVERMGAGGKLLDTRVADRDHELIRVRAERDQYQRWNADSNRLLAVVMRGNSEYSKHLRVAEDAAEDAIEELAEARAERDRLRAAIEENTFHDRDEYTHECLPNCWRCELAATPAEAERTEQGEQDIADSGLWCSVHGRWVTQADTHAGCTAVVRVDGGCPA